MAIDIHSAALKELQRFPSPVLFRAKEAFAFLELGEKLSLPLSRPMPSIWPGCHEIRISDRQGTFRIIYVFVTKGNIFVPHCFQKKSQSTPLSDIALAKRRIKEFCDGR
ncbi:MAG: type II toxin-antitoxin system RelE/ParE family toxin [Proteobacteria bacterium]|nr:type II toxin-antitoxin system RelE/ParE family toxin [Pseudomonadota bacterium]